MNKRALLLNADFSPLHFVSDVRAVRLLMNGRGEIIYDFETGLPSIWEEAFTSPGESFDAPMKSIPVPATLKLKRMVNKRWKAPRFRKQVLFNRDKWRCQYCNEKLNWSNIEIEHVLPISRGGPTTWLNCVSACRPCNKRKANMTPEEAGMRLLRVPADPMPLHFWDAAKSDCWHETWNTFIPHE